MSDWKFFVLGAGRTPLPNCPRCSWQSATATRHDPEDCPCLTCHGFYAATNDPSVLAYMSATYPSNEWAVRTGAASGIIVLDFEGPDKDPEGLTTLDRWESYTGWSLPSGGLSARTPSGGVHLYIQHPGGKIPSRNRILPGCDLKADGGYVVVPHVNSPGRRWDNATAGPAPINDELTAWLAARRGSSGGGGGGPGRATGYDYRRFILDGCPDGARDEFFNDLLFRCRKQNMTIEVAWDFARFHWSRCAQPPEAEWYMPWENVEYKLHRVWRTVEPTELAPEQSAWVRGLDATGRRGVDITFDDPLQPGVRRRGRAYILDQNT